MPRYEFKALDSAGLLQAGVVDAPSPNDVVRQLSTRGLKVQFVQPASAGGAVAASPAPTSPRPVQQVAQPVAQRVNSNPPSARPGSARQTVVAAAAPVLEQPVCKVKTASDQDTYFLFAQLANLFRGGLTPTNAFDNMSQRTRNKGWPEAFRHIAQMVSQGTSLSTAMQVYPTIFNPGDIGAVEAGELGGYLWQACEHVAESAKSTMKLRKTYNWVSFIFWSNVLTLPLIGVAIKAMEGGLRSINDPSVAPLANMGKYAVSALFGPWGAITVLGIAAYYGIRWYLQRPPLRAFRHNVARHVPLLKQRTEAANAEAFAFHLQLLQNAGISPHRSWAAAAKAVPNVAISEDLQGKAPEMGETSRLSEGFYKTRLFPEEMGHLLQTGEMTGQVGRALEDSRQMSQSKAQTYQAILITKGFVWMALILFAATALSGAILMRGFYDSAFHIVLDNNDQGSQP